MYLSNLMKNKIQQNSELKFAKGACSRRRAGLAETVEFATIPRPLKSDAQHRGQIEFAEMPGNKPPMEKVNMMLFYNNDYYSN
ncbi:hypothetical protein NECAME_00758 [Necator americanus]|uniref:Uncharacterized protein n=1 Tax=Necator americanus TaxID=51031 RepID=W2SVJ4_NECAM|nr:hypothetical protein NECAME_00758 [Necator americanus]ETN73670.1 hypothetical protein NECAME_00758 [Necator americanus]